MQDKETQITTNFASEPSASYVTPAFIIGFVGHGGVALLPRLAEAVIAWEDTELEVETDADAEDDAAHNSIQASQLQELAQDDDGDEQDDADDADESDDDTDQDAADKEYDGSTLTMHDSIMVPTLSLTVRLSAVAVREFNAFQDQHEGTDETMLVQIAYGSRTNPAFWHTYEVSMGDLELAHTGSQMTHEGYAIAHLQLSVEDVTKFSASPMTETDIPVAK